MRRGDVWWIAFGSHTGTEICKPGLAVIVNHKGSNPNTDNIQVVPIRSGQTRVFPWEAAITVKREAFTAAADQIITVNQTRLTAFVDHLSANDLRRVHAALRNQLGL